MYDDSRGPRPRWSGSTRPARRVGASSATGGCSPPGRCRSCCGCCASTRPARRRPRSPTRPTSSTGGWPGTRWPPTSATRSRPGPTSSTRPGPRTSSTRSASPPAVLPAAGAARHAARDGLRGGRRSDRPPRGDPRRRRDDRRLRRPAGPGASRSGSWNSVLGTTLVLKGVSEDLLHDPFGVVYSHRGPARRLAARRRVQHRRGPVARDFPGRDLDVLDRRPRRREPAGCCAYPLVPAGERFPSSRRTPWVPAGRAGDDAEDFAAVLQGVGYLERLCFDHLDLLGAPTGGASSSPAAPPAAGTGASCAPTCSAGPCAAPRMPSPRSAWPFSPPPPGRDVGRAAGRDGRRRRVIDHGPGTTRVFDEPYPRLRRSSWNGAGWLPARPPRPTHAKRTVPMTDLFLVRHGQTVWHAENRYAGAATSRSPREAWSRPPSSRCGRRPPASPRCGRSTLSRARHHGGGVQRGGRPSAAGRRAAVRARLRRGRGPDLGGDDASGSPTPVPPSSPTP